MTAISSMAAAKSNCLTRSPENIPAPPTRGSGNLCFRRTSDLPTAGPGWSADITCTKTF
jgi:hypothetical protein